MSEGFFSRWSRRKQEAGQEAQEGSPRFARDDEGVAAEPADTRHGQAEGRGHPESVAPAAEPAPSPTLDNVRTLTPESDFQPFMQPGVGPEVRNAAMKKLFTDPHFNVMDGLDIYIDDYSQPDPMPVGMLQQMASAQFLKLVPPEDTPEDVPEDTYAQASIHPDPEVVAQSPQALAPAEPPEHEHTDLQLQPDPSLAGPGTEPGAG